MDVSTAKKLAEATGRFYRLQCRSFSDTRQSPWQGWDRIDGIARELAPAFDMLDLACGNMRLEEYLAETLPDISVATYAFDNCEALAELGKADAKTHFRELDLMAELEHGTLYRSLDGLCPHCELSVSFGFMHHIPSLQWRKDFLDALIGMTVPMGYVIVSFWQISKSEKLIAKAMEATEIGCKELDVELSTNNGDYLMGWKDVKGVYRYVHDFSDDEIAELVHFAATKGARLYKTYCADGKTGNLNRYVILKKDVV